MAWNHFGSEHCCFNICKSVMWNVKGQKTFVCVCVENSFWTTVVVMDLLCFALFLFSFVIWHLFVPDQVFIVKNK